MVLGPCVHAVLLLTLSSKHARRADALPSLTQKGKGGAFAQFGTNAYAHQGGAMMAGGGMMWVELV